MNTFQAPKQCIFVRPENLEALSEQIRGRHYTISVVPKQTKKGAVFYQVYLTRFDGDMKSIVFVLPREAILKRIDTDLTNEFESTATVDLTPAHDWVNHYQIFLDMVYLRVLEVIQNMAQTGVKYAPTRLYGTLDNFVIPAFNGTAMHEIEESLEGLVGKNFMDEKAPLLQMKLSVCWMGTNDTNMKLQIGSRFQLVKPLFPRTEGEGRRRKRARVDSAEPQKDHQLEWSSMREGPSMCGFSSEK